MHVSRRRRFPRVARSVAAAARASGWDAHLGSLSPRPVSARPCPCPCLCLCPCLWSLPLEIKDITWQDVAVAALNAGMIRFGVAWLLHPSCIVKGGVIYTSFHVVCPSEDTARLLPPVLPDFQLYFTLSWSCLFSIHKTLAVSWSSTMLLCTHFASTAALSKEELLSFSSALLSHPSALFSFSSVMFSILDW